MGHMDAAARRALGARLRRAREERGLSGAELARRVGTSAHSLWRYEDGRVAPGPLVLVKLASELATSVEWLITGQNSVATGTEGV